MKLDIKGSDFTLTSKNPRQSKKKRRSVAKTALSTAALLILASFAGLAVYLTVFLKDISASLPSTSDILNYEPSLATIVYDRYGNVITHLFEENRNWVKLDTVSPWVVKAFLAAEDSTFYEHSGICPTAILRATIIDLFHGKAKQGGSTITQQLARNLFLTKEKTIVRKAKEAILSLRLEKIYTKDQILEMYVNTIYMGHGAYGIDSAARLYYAKAPIDLTLSEAALLAGLLTAPETYSPYRHPDLSNVKKKYVLDRMLELDWISQKDYDAAVANIPALAKRENKKSSLSLKEAPHFISYVLFGDLLPAYGVDGVYRGGLRVHTTINMDLQRKAEELIANMKHEGALVALDPHTGEILALVGGRNFDDSKFNRATQAYRQPGSSFKPIVYATALELGYRGVDHVLDAPLTFPNGWAPDNYTSGEYSGEVTLMYALAHSLNTAAVRLAQIDGVGRVAEMARRLGITSKYLPEDLSMALGTASVTPLEMGVVYSTFANNGYRVEPFGVQKVLSRGGQVLEQRGPNLRSVISPTTAVSMRSMLEQVAMWGTGAKARIAGYQCFGKTGTTNDWTDAWFVGGVPGLVCVVYVGNDDHRTLGNKITGSVAALPVWREFMTFAIERLSLEKSFTLPSEAEVESVKVCRTTGFLAAPGCPASKILLPLGQAPLAHCPWHGGNILEAKADAHAPQLLIAPIDNEMPPYDKYRLPELVAPHMQESVYAPVTTKKPSSPLPSKLPDTDKKPAAPTEEMDIETRYQNLLRQYGIID